MASDIKKYLYDILLSIETHLQNTNTFSKFTRNLLLMDAVERRLAIIGETLNKAVKIQTDLRVSNKIEFIKLRHLLIHHYDESDEAIIWNIIKNDLPVLKQEIELLLKD
ncbi:MAG: hypothetical protein JWQ40_910 [Segetibacter sp.]|nr:hypothetical protein [Segetibacter sp.]